MFYRRWSANQSQLNGARSRTDTDRDARMGFPLEGIGIDSSTKSSIGVKSTLSSGTEGGESPGMVAMAVEVVARAGARVETPAVPGLSLRAR
jgi:hypothetical protein